MDAIKKVSDKATDALSDVGGKSFKIGVSVPLLLVMIVWLILCVVLGYFIQDNDLIYFCYVLCGWAFAIMIHEMGHAAFASKAGDGSVDDYTNGNFIKWESIINNFAVPMVLPPLLGIGMNGGLTWLSETRLAFAGKVDRMLIAFGGPIFSLGLAVVLVIPLWIFSGGVNSPAYYGTACIIYFITMTVVVNMIPLPPMDMFNIIFPFLPEKIQVVATKYLAHKWYSLLLFVVVIFVIWLLSGLVWSLMSLIMSILMIEDEALAGLNRFWILLN
jgi:hypothetical protein